MYIKNSINFSIISNLNIKEEKEIEFIFANLDFLGNCVICGTVYKPPNTNSEHHNVFLNTLELCLQNIGQKMYFKWRYELKFD